MNVICPVCQFTDTETLGPPIYRRPTRCAGMPIDLSDLELLWRRCRRCGYQFMQPGIPQQRLLDCYAKAELGYWGTADEVARERFYAQKKQLLERFSPGKRVLDFGCFDGGFLAYLGDGFEKLGIEPAADAARAAERRGVRIVGSTIADTTDVQAVDAIVAMDVFEHLPDPVSVLRDFRRLLRAGGIALIETGNSDEPLWRRLGLRYPYMTPVEHIGVFNESSIREAGRRAGLELVHFQPTAHHVLHARHRITYPFYNVAYRILRGLEAIKFPLPRPLRDIARGPLPRTTRDDHFLAVLKAT